jgi:hypothetical protein
MKTNDRHVMRVVESTLPAGMSIEDYRRMRPKPRTTRERVIESIVRVKR